MSRSRIWGAAAALGLVIGAGCAHCDTCDEVPVPCTGPGCSAALRVVPPAGPMVAAPIPIPAGTPGPFTPSVPVTSGPAANVTGPESGIGSTPSFATPPLPDVPANAPATPPSGPVAPEKP